MLDETKAQLADPNAGWVTRRDAAKKLGEVAVEALTALHGQLDIDDVDVRGAVNDAVRSVAKCFSGIELTAAAPACSLADAVKACERPGKREIEKVGAGYIVHVKLDGGRKQSVHVTPFEWQDGTKLVRVFTRCGPMSEDAVRWALRTNLKITHGALALAKEGDGEEFVLTKVFLADDLSEEGVKASVKQLAHYGDWMENKLTGLDDF